MSNLNTKVAYFCAEYGISNSFPMNGGLGVLAGELAKSAADQGRPMVFVGNFYRMGNFHQRLGPTGQQHEYYVPFDPTGIMHPLRGSVRIPIQDREVIVRAYEFGVRSSIRGKDNEAPLLYLFVEPNGNEFDANINGRLYPGKGKEENRHIHMAQEVLLGIGGMRMLEEQGYTGIEIVHLNEGHAALAPFELMQKIGEQATRARTVYTTHTPVPAGIDAFDAGDAHYILPKTFGDGREIGRLTHSSGLHMMKLAMALSGKSNAVSELHRDVSQALFSDFPNMSNLRYVDNGVHLPTWTAPNIQVLYDRISPGWREHPRTLETALLDLTPEEVLGAHAIPKARLGEFIDDNLGHRVRGYNHFDPEKLTIGFARRFATYKQANLVFEHLDRVKELGKDVQIVFAGKAHPTDDGGKGVIKDVFKYMKELQEHMSIWFIEDYDMDMARFMVQGVDVWLNTPQQYEEASGTSGMKAAINFVPQLSIIDGWWTRDQQREGYRHPKGLVEGVTGWGIGNDPSMEHFKRVNADWSLRERMRVDNARDLIEKIGGVIVPLFKGDKKGWADVGKHAAALNGSYYNSHRMLDEYWKLYDLGHGL